MLDETTNLNIVLERLKNLESSIKRDLSKKETQVVMIYLEVVKSSIQYWNENFLKWDVILSDGKTKSFWDDVQSKKWWKEVWRVTKKIAVQDAIGGAVVGVGAVAVNTIPGLGQVTYGSAIFLGASSKSAYAAIDIAKNYDCEIVVNVPVTIAGVLKNDDNLCMVYADNLDQIETYSENKVDLSNVALYAELDSYLYNYPGFDKENQLIYIYAFYSKNDSSILVNHLDEIEDKSIEIKRILVGCTTYKNLRGRPQLGGL